MIQQEAEKTNEQVLLLLPCLLAQGMQVASFYWVRVGVCSEVGLEGWLRCVAHSFGGVCAGILCSTLLLLPTPGFCSLLFKCGFGLFWSSCIFLSRIFPNRVGMQLFFSSVLFSRSVMSDSSRPHELQHARPPCPSTTPGVHSDSCPSSR